MIREPHAAEGETGTRSDLTLLRVDLDDPRWLGFVESRDEATPFHHPSWCEVLREAYGFRPFALVLERTDGAVAAGLPLMEVGGRRRKRWVSLPFTDVCATLADDDVKPALVALLEDARREARIGRIEVRGSLEGPIAQQATRGYTHVLALREDSQELLKTFSRSQVQRNITRAQREGVVVRRGERAAELLDTFYRLHLLTRRRLGVPIQPRKFFEQLWERMLERGLGFVLVAEVGGKAAAAAVFLAWNGTLTYKFGASDPASWSARPNHALFWDAIRWGCEHGFAQLDFGRTDLDNEGLRAFKQGWGTTEADLVYSALGGAADHGSGRLEAALGNVIRRSPPWVCRLAGETLYRYAA